MVQHFLKFECMNWTDQERSGPRGPLSSPDCSFLVILMSFFRVCLIIGAKPCRPVDLEGQRWEALIAGLYHVQAILEFILFCYSLMLMPLIFNCHRSTITTNPADVKRYYEIQLERWCWTTSCLWIVHLLYTRAVQQVSCLLIKLNESKH